MAKRIALAGKPLSGKTTLARLMGTKYGYRHASMSDLIVDEYARFSGLPKDEIYKNKETYRQNLQLVGDGLGFQDPDRILKLMHRVLYLAGAWEHPNDPVVLESIRGEVQASAARAFGFIVVELWIDEQEQQKRVGSLEDYHSLLSASLARPDIESGVKSASIRLTQALPIEDMATLLYIQNEEVLSRGPADQPFTPGSLADWGSL